MQDLALINSLRTGADILVDNLREAELELTSEQATRKVVEALALLEAAQRRLGEAAEVQFIKVQQVRRAA